MIVIEKNEGKKIAYELNGTRLSFADGELTLNLARYQQDDPVTRDIMVDNEGYLTTGRGRYYVAQVEIPAAEYKDVAAEQEETTDRERLPLDTGKVTLSLFAIDGIIIQ
jgi:hypothetical protein